MKTKARRRRRISAYYNSLWYATGRLALREVKGGYEVYDGKLYSRLYVSRKDAKKEIQKHNLKVKRGVVRWQDGIW